MSIKLPELCTKKYADISEEMCTSIPKYTGKWTNFNPSDPGITILELLAWIGETTLYRVDRMPMEAYTSFLRLVAGASGVSDIKKLMEKSDPDVAHREILEFLLEVEEGKEKTVDEMKAAALHFLSSRYRAVTEEDFRTLAIEATESGRFHTKVKRVVVLPRKPEVEIIVIPDEWHKFEINSNSREANYKELIEHVTNYLNPRRLIGTVIQVKKPSFTHVNIDIEVIPQTYAKVDDVREQVRTGVEKYLHPLEGGPEGKGWPYGRSLTVYEIAQVVEKTAGVKRMK